MNQGQKQPENALRVLVAALEHHARTLELERRMTEDRQSKSRLAAASRLAIALSEEIAAIVNLRDLRANSPKGADQAEIQDLSTAFKDCLSLLPLGPIRDHVVQGFLSLRRLSSTH